MNVYRKSVKIFLSVVTLFIVINAFIWNFCVKDLFYGVKDLDVGALGRLGYTRKGFFLRKTNIDLSKRHTQYKDYNGEEIDLITIGDSFSNEAGRGKNPYYQDYIASYNDMSVMNVKVSLDAEENYKFNNIYVLIGLINNGFFDKVKPEHIIYQSVERHAVERLGYKLNFSFQLKTKDELDTKTTEEKLKFINIANLKYLTNLILYNFSDNAFGSQTYIKKLSKDLFTSKEPSILLFFYKDLNRIENSTDEKINILNKNLNIIADKLADKGINFYFMPAVDKYNLYYPYIIDNKHPKSVFFEKLRSLDKKYTLIDTKEILSKELKKEEKDIYYSDDTHWSYKACEAIFQQTKFE